MDDDPFVMALEDLADSDLGIDLTYQQKEGGPSFPVRARLSRPEQREAGAAPRSPGAMMIAVEAVITVAAFERVFSSKPQKGDLLGQGSRYGWRVATVRQDERENSYVLGLGRQD